jgi:hypothetical protein
MPIVRGLQILIIQRDGLQISSVQNNFYDNNFHVDYITNLKDIEL